VYLARAFSAFHVCGTITVRIISAGNPFPPHKAESPADVESMRKLHWPLKDIISRFSGLLHDTVMMNSSIAIELLINVFGLFTE
jgi:hypothetical protein